MRIFRESNPEAWLAPAWQIWVQTKKNPSRLKQLDEQGFTLCTNAYQGMS